MKCQDCPFETTSPIGLRVHIGKAQHTPRKKRSRL